MIETESRGRDNLHGSKTDGQLLFLQYKDIERKEIKILRSSLTPCSRWQRYFFFFS